MASSIIDLIRSNKAKPVRKLYIKRRDTAGDYESSWVQIDNYLTIDRVVNWGSISIETDSDDRRIGVFNISGMTIKLKNEDGLFNVETDSRSIWSGFLNRKLTKVKVDCGYLDTDGETEIGVENVFEGIIDTVKIGDNQQATVRVLSYQSVLQKYEISDLSFAGNKTINTIVDLIMDQAKITTYIPAIASDADQNVTVADTENLEGSYWDVLKQMASLSNSVPLLIGATWAFKAGAVSGASVFDFKGHGVDVSNDIYRINFFDDEGANRVRVHWIVESSDPIIEAKSVDANLLLKYLGEPELVDLSDVNSALDKLAIVDALLAEWENPKPVIEFDTRFFINQISPLNKITIEIKGQTVPASTFTWGAWKWGDGSKWGKYLGSIIIQSSTDWKVLKVVKDIQNWKTSIRADVVS